MNARLDVPVLSGSSVRLEPLAMRHAPDLARAAEEDRSSYDFTVVPRANEMRSCLQAQLDRPGLTPFAQVRVRDGRAFEVLGVTRVDLKTDARNQRSRRAIERLGAHFEGVLRRWSPSWAPGEEGLLRDSALFSVIAPEWPAVKAGLQELLAVATTGRPGA
ncbi:N-acetyltransferase [Nonomuraea terrae]|uniref:N-acetyltransferase n=1 Tax=Nonomuraea terrae TaxID=2530383 RepID=A0A4R4Z5R3_9ACTN|nr:GNAT family protein [Nonomuraea terrae]TDD53236.1 N-acetyltransferase [Nonomuraea terrae]